MQEMSISQMLTEYNSKAPAAGLKPRKSFRSREDAEKAMKSLNGASKVEKKERKAKIHLEGIFAAFNTPPNSQQGRILAVLFENIGKPVSIKALTAGGKDKGSLNASIAGLIAKSKGQLMRGLGKPPYAISKSKIEKEMHVVLQTQ